MKTELIASRSLPSCIRRCKVPEPISRRMDSPSASTSIPDCTLFGSGYDVPVPSIVILISIRANYEVLVNESFYLVSRHLWLYDVLKGVYEQS